MNVAHTGTRQPDLRSLLPLSPDAYPQALDLVRGLVLAIRMDAAGYRAASFLDDRVLGPGTQGAWFPEGEAIAAARTVTQPRPVHFLFHAGHVGSTLVSRLLDETGVVLGIREPLPLRTLSEARESLGRPDAVLAESRHDSLLAMLLGLWSRGYPATRAVVVKATSSAAVLAPALLAAAPSARAACLNLRAEPYLATLLGGANSAIDLLGHGPGRMRRLLRGRELTVAPLHALSPGELAALAWVVESLAHRAAAESAPGRVLALDFDDVLMGLPDALRRLLAHFGLPADDARVAALARSDVLRRYSKAPDRPYPASERAERLAASRRENRAEIAKGLAWLSRLAAEDDGIGAVVAGSGA